MVWSKTESPFLAPCPAPFRWRSLPPDVPGMASLARVEAPQWAQSLDGHRCPHLALWSPISVGVAVIFSGRRALAASGGLFFARFNLEIKNDDVEF